MIVLLLHECSLSGVDNHRWLEHTTQTLLAHKTILNFMHSQAVGTQKLWALALLLGASASSCSFACISTSSCTSASVSICSFEVVGTLNQIILYLHDVITGGRGHQWGNMILHGLTSSANAKCSLRGG